jgi:hypothetical protein
MGLRFNGMLHGQQPKGLKSAWRFGDLRMVGNKHPIKTHEPMAKAELEEFVDKIPDDKGKGGAYSEDSSRRIAPNWRSTRELARDNILPPAIGLILQKDTSRGHQATCHM